MSKQSFNFDRLVDRKGTDSVKWDAIEKVFGENAPEDTLPMWVADMDFYPPEELFRDVNERAQHPVYGYTMPPADFATVAKDWIGRHYDREIAEEDFVFSPGIVPAIGVAMRALLEPGDGVMIMTPVYGPFYRSIKNNKMTEQAVPLIQDGKRWTIDFDKMEATVDEKTKMLLLCSPHNPIGRVWTMEELEQLRDFCVKHDLYLVSDEIHADFIYRESEMISLATLDGMKDRSITCYAPSKTFSIAGLGCSGIVIENEELRDKFKAEMSCSGLGGKVFGYRAMYSVWKHGDAWLEALIAYLEANRDYLLEEFAKLEEYGIVAQPPESTFLMFIDCHGLMEQKGMQDQEALKKFWLEDCHLALNSGTDYGENGAGFMRLNFGCPRSLLEEAVARIRKALKIA